MAKWLAAGACVGKPLFSFEVSATVWLSVSPCRTELTEQLATPTPNKKRKPPAQRHSRALRRRPPHQAQGNDGEQMLPNAQITSNVAAAA